MKTLYLDCQAGAAGDMIAGALLELMPDPDAAVAELNAIGVPGVVYRRETMPKSGIAATHLAVLVNGEEEGRSHHRGHDHDHHPGRHHHHEHRSLADMLRIIGGLSLGGRAKAAAAKVYEAIATAESRAHGRPAGEVHFHEVGAMDAVADVAAASHLMERLGPDEVIASPVHVGFGSVECAHGTLPVPAPATAFLLENIPTYSDGVTRGELCTPTGAALLKTFAKAFGPQPLMRVKRVGHGAGVKDFARANIVRALFGERDQAADGAADGMIWELDFNVDDMTGEELAFAAERIFAAGAKDVAFIPLVMKKGRPGHMAVIMCMADEKPAVVEAVFAHTSTLGVREKLCGRYTLKRTIESWRLADGSVVRRKVAAGHGASRAKWEAGDLAALAARHSISLSEARAKLEKEGMQS